MIVDCCLGVKGVGGAEYMPQGVDSIRGLARVMVVMSQPPSSYFHKV